MYRLIFHAYFQCGGVNLQKPMHYNSDSSIMASNLKNCHVRLVNLHPLPDPQDPSSFPRYVCAYCTEHLHIASRLSNLKAHFSGKHPEQFPPAFVCDYCDATFVTRQNLNYHQQNNVCTKQAQAVSKEVADFNATMEAHDRWDFS